jgi:hypothetical protein
MSITTVSMGTTLNSITGTYFRVQIRPRSLGSLPYNMSSESVISVGISNGNYTTILLSTFLRFDHASVYG